MKIKNIVKNCSVGLALCMVGLFSQNTLSQNTQTQNFESQKQTQAKINALKAEIKKMYMQQNQTDSLRLLEEKAYQKWLKSFEEDVKKRQEELAGQSEKISNLEKQIQAELVKQNNYENSKKEIESKRNLYNKTLLESIASLTSLIEKGLPWKKEEKLDRLNSLRRELESQQTTPEEGLGRLSSLYKEEIKQGDEITINNVPQIRKDGSIVNAQLLKIGNQWMVYMDDEGKSFGILRKTKTGYVWIEDLNFEERKAVKDALAVKLAKKPPQLVTLPLSLAIEPEVN